MSFIEVLCHLRCVLIIACCILMSWESLALCLLHGAAASDTCWPLLLLVWQGLRSAYIDKCPSSVCWLDVQKLTYIHSPEDAEPVTVTGVLCRGAMSHRAKKHRLARLWQKVLEYEVPRCERVCANNSGF